VLASPSATIDCRGLWLSVWNCLFSTGKHHNEAVAIVAHKLVRKLYALLKLRAERRRALAEAQPDKPPPPAVVYRLIDPASGTPLSRRQARAYISTRFPSKAKRRAAAATSQKTGSPKGATKVSTATPPTTFLPDLAICGKSQGNSCATT